MLVRIVIVVRWCLSNAQLISRGQILTNTGVTGKSMFVHVNLGVIETLTNMPVLI